MIGSWDGFRGIPCDKMRCVSDFDTTQPPILDYQEPTPPQVCWGKAMVSLFAGGFALLMNLLFWEGAFTSYYLGLPFLAALVTVILPLIGLHFAVHCNLRHWLAWMGILTSTASVFVSLGLVAYFLTHLPNC